MYHESGLHPTSVPDSSLFTFAAVSQPHLPDVLRRRNALLLLEHPAEMLRVFEAEAVGHLGDGFPCRQPVLCKLYDELADVVARRVAGGLLDDIAEIVGGHAELVGTILHGGQAEGQLELVLEIVAEQAVEATRMSEFSIFRVTNWRL